MIAWVIKFNKKAVYTPPTLPVNVLILIFSLQNITNYLNEIEILKRKQKDKERAKSTFPFLLNLLHEEFNE